MDDLISRQGAIEALNKEIIRRRLLDDVNEMLDEFDTEDILKKLPSAQPERKKGKWRVYEGEMTCSCCETTFYTDMCEYIDGNVPKFCPWCGAEMRGDGNDN